MKSTSFIGRAVFAIALAPLFARVIAQGVGGNANLPVTTGLASGYSQLTNANTNLSATNVSSTAPVSTQQEAVSKYPLAAATSPTLSSLGAVSNSAFTAPALSTTSMGASYAPTAAVVTSLAPIGNTLPTRPVISTPSTSNNRFLTPTPLAGAPPDTRRPAASSLLNWLTSAISPVGLETLGANSKFSPAPSGNTLVGTANSGFAPPTSSRTLPSAGTPAAVSYNSAVSQPTTTRDGTMINISSQMTFATRPTGNNNANIANLKSTAPFSLATLPAWNSSPVVANTHALTSRPLPTSSMASVAAMGRFTTIVLSNTKPGDVPANSLLAMIPSPTTSRTAAPPITSGAAIPPMTTTPEAAYSKVAATIPLSLTTPRANAPGVSFPKADISSVTSSIMANPTLLRAITKVNLGYETSTRLVNGHITHDVFAKTVTKTWYVGTTDTFSTITTATKVTTAPPFALPTEIPKQNRAEVNFGFSSGVPLGFYDRTIPMPAHSCPRDAIAALARYRHFRRVTGMEAGWHQPSIDKCCGIYMCNDRGWLCDSYTRVGIAPGWADYNRNDIWECKEWRPRNDAQFNFYMQNLHVFGLSDVDEKGWINEGPRKGQCCPDDGPPIDFGPHVAVKIVA